MASTRKVKTKRTELMCPECETVQPIHRRIGKMKEKDHIKHLYCWVCQEVTGHIEKGDEVHYPEWLQEDEEDYDDEEEE